MNCKLYFLYLMSYLNQIHLNKDIALLKSTHKDLGMQIRNYDSKFNYLIRLNKSLKKEIVDNNFIIDKKLDDNLSTLNDMLVDVISDIQMIKIEIEQLKTNKELVVTNEIKKKENIDLLEKHKEVLDFINNLGFDKDYNDIIYSLDCKTIEDIKMFQEDELVKSGFLLLHARKILKD